MLKLTNTASQAQGACLARMNRFFLTTSLLFCLFSAVWTISPAQSPTWVNAQEFDFAIHLPDGTLNSGDTVFAEIHLGTAYTLAEDLCGLDLYLELSEHAALPETFAVDTSGSWLFGGTEINGNTEVRPSNRLLEVFQYRTDSVGQSGWGNVLRIPVVAASDNVPASELLVDGGGLVLVDNVDMKTSAVVRTRVMRLGDAETLTNVSEATGEMDLSLLPPGLYFVVETDAKGRNHVRKLLKR